MYEGDCWRLDDASRDNFRLSMVPDVARLGKASRGVFGVWISKAVTTVLPAFFCCPSPALVAAANAPFVPLYVLVSGLGVGGGAWNATDAPLRADPGVVPAASRVVEPGCWSVEPVLNGAGDFMESWD